MPLLRGRLLEWANDWLERAGYLEGSRSCAGCRLIVELDYWEGEHDHCLTPVERHPAVAFSLLPPLVTYTVRRALPDWRVQQLQPASRRDAGGPQRALTKPN